MPTEESRSPNVGSTRHPLAGRRILRLALGTALALWFSQIFAWPLSFIAPLVTMLILCTPLPAPGLKQGLGLVFAMVLPMLAGMLFLMPFMVHARWAGVLLVGLALFHCFHFTARGGSPLLGTFLTMGLTIVVTVGSVNGDIMVLLVKSIAVSAFAGMVFVWIAHAVLPDPPRGRRVPTQVPAARPVTPGEARRLALRSMVVVMPLALVFLYVSGSPGYTVVMIKSAALGQQATVGGARRMGRELFLSTWWGGVVAIAIWSLLSVWPSLLLYGLLIGLAGLYFGRGVFRGPGMHPGASLWSYAFLTVAILLGPVVNDGFLSDGASAAFWNRLWLIFLLGVYATAAVAAFDAFWPAKRNTALDDAPAPATPGSRDPAAGTA